MYVPVTVKETVTRRATAGDVAFLVADLRNALTSSVLSKSTTTANRPDPILVEWTGDPAVDLTLTVWVDPSVLDRAHYRAQLAEDARVAILNFLVESQR